MTFQLRLISVWKFVALSTIMTMIIEFSIIIITKGSLFPLIYGLIVFGVIFISMIISSFLCLTSNTIEIKDNEILIGKRRINLTSIDYYYHDENFFFDGIRIKTKQNKNYYFTTINFYKKDLNFNVLKGFIVTKNIDNNFSIKTGDDLIKESKGLKYISYVLIGLLIIVILLTLFTDFKMTSTKFIYLSLIAIGLFIKTKN
jgi:hypothetical protein